MTRRSVCLPLVLLALLVACETVPRDNPFDPGSAALEAISLDVTPGAPAWRITISLGTLANHPSLAAGEPVKLLLERDISAVACDETREREVDCNLHATVQSWTPPFAPVLEATDLLRLPGGPKSVTYRLVPEGLEAWKSVTTTAVDVDGDGAEDDCDDGDAAFKGCSAGSDCVRRANAWTCSGCPEGFIGDGTTCSCDPQAEVCDGKDNDCNDKVDDLPAIPCGTGACARTLAACTAGAATVCDPVDGASPEICNAIDDDCDGETDEDLGTETCGQGACLHTVAVCKDGNTVACDPFEGALSETCNGIDDDCDGEVDEAAAGGKLTRELLTGQPNASGLLVCGAGVEVCSAAAGSGSASWTVQREAVLPAPEVCDGYDQDCDGVADSTGGVALSRSCTPFDPALVNVGVCRSGTQSCSGSGGVETWAECTGYVAPSIELCNGRDDDCDGAVDELLGNTDCGYGRCLARVQNCVGGNSQQCVPRREEVKSEVCNGVDDDCDGAIDREPSGALLSQSCYTFEKTAAQLAAGNNNIGECRDGRKFCTSAAVTIIPNAPPSYPGGTLWGSCSDIGPATDICDGKDNDCDGTIDNDASRYCGGAAHASVGCGLGACVITACDVDYFDKNGAYVDGCECYGSSVSTCVTAP